MDREVKTATLVSNSGEFVRWDSWTNVEKKVKRRWQKTEKYCFWEFSTLGSRRVTTEDGPECCQPRWVLEVGDLDFPQLSPNVTLAIPYQPARSPQIGTKQMSSRSKMSRTLCLWVEIGPLEDKRTSAHTHTHTQTRPVWPGLSACAVNLLLKTLIHTLLFHVRTHALHVLHLVCVYLDAPGCRAPSSKPLHISLPECIGGDFWDFFSPSSCLPEGMWSLWLIRGSPVSDCQQPPLFQRSAPSSLVIADPCCKPGTPAEQVLQREPKLSDGDQLQNSRENIFDFFAHKAKNSLNTIVHLIGI